MNDATDTTSRIDDTSRASGAACHTRFGIFPECPLCGGALAPEHAHYKCFSCGWRDSCCD